MLHLPAYLTHDGSDLEPDSDDPSYAPEDDSPDNEVPSMSTAQQPRPSKRKKVTKIVRKWKKAGLSAQPVAGKVTEPPNAPTQSKGVVCHYLETRGHPPETGQRRRPSQKLNIDSRYDSMNHVIGKTNTVC